MIYTNEQIRRQDRTLNEQRALELLKDGEYGVLSMKSDDDNGTYGIPMSYVWNGKDIIYIHCAPEGKKLRCIDRCNLLSFCVVGRTKLIPEKFTTAYESIVLKCKASHLLPDEERKSALSLFVSKYCPQQKEEAIKAAEKSFHRTEIIRLDILTMSGKTKACF